MNYDTWLQSDKAWEDYWGDDAREVEEEDQRRRSISRKRWITAQLHSNDGFNDDRRRELKGIEGEKNEKTD